MGNELQDPGPFGYAVVKFPDRVLFRVNLTELCNELTSFHAQLSIRIDLTHTHIIQIDK